MTLPAAAVLLGLLQPAGATASRSERTILDATGSLVSVDAKERRARLNELDALGVDTVRLQVQWRSFAPGPGRPRPPAGFDAANPADYPNGPFDALDETIRGAVSRGMRVLLTPTSPIPDWASRSGHSRLAYPEPAEFRSFVAALGRRYSGHFRAGKPLPRVTFWSIWSEPNQDLFLRPQFRRGKPYSPRLYRRLFLAAQAGLAATGHRKDALLIGETAPSGGRDGVDPLDFLRGVLCLDGAYHHKRGCAPISAHGWAHHPYSEGRDAPYERPRNKNLISLATIGRMTSALRKAARAGATTHRLPVFMTEYGVQTGAAHDGVGPKKQAAYLAIAEFLAWKNRAIRSYAQYLLRDDPPRYEFAFTTGLRYHRGAEKPSYRSFPLTLLANRNGGRVRIWGHVRPGRGPYRVEVRFRNRNGASHRLRFVRANRRGYFSFASPYRAGRRWAARCRLPDGRNLAGPYLHAFSF